MHAVLWLCIYTNDVLRLTMMSDGGGDDDDDDVFPGWRRQSSQLPSPFTTFTSSGRWACTATEHRWSATHMTITTSWFTSLSTSNSSLTASYRSSSWLSSTCASLSVYVRRLLGSAWTRSAFLRRRSTRPVGLSLTDRVDISSLKSLRRRNNLCRKTPSMKETPRNIRPCRTNQGRRVAARWCRWFEPVWATSRSPVLALLSFVSPYLTRRRLIWFSNSPRGDVGK